MDKILEEALRKERKRQEDNIELIASENYVSNDILKLQGSILTNKYAEGYPGKRYYGGCEYIDIFESQTMQKNYLGLYMPMSNLIQVQVLIWLFIEHFLIMATK